MSMRVAIVRSLLIATMPLGILIMFPQTEQAQATTTISTVSKIPILCRIVPEFCYHIDPVIILNASDISVNEGIVITSMQNSSVLIAKVPLNETGRFVQLLQQLNMTQP